MASNSQYEELIARGTSCLGAGDYFEAVEALEKALLIKDSVMVRNQLALAFYYDNQPIKALEVLRSTLKLSESQPFYHPFSFSLASIILSALGKSHEASDFLDLAIDGYREGSSLLREAGLPFDPVGAYLAIVMKAAGELQQHQRLLEIYESWKKEYLSWECVYYAAAAAFNLGLYKLAGDYWALIGATVPICQRMQKLALMVQQGIIPAFALEYQVVSSQELQAQLEMSFSDSSYRDSFAGRGYARMLLLGHLLGTETANEENAFIILNALSGSGNEWGLELNRRLWKHPETPLSVRQAAGKCLVGAGQLEPGDLPCQDDLDEPSAGGLEVIKVDYSDEMEAVFEKACVLASQGRLDQALLLWEETLFEKRCLHPPGLFNMVDLYIETRRYEDAGAILDLLEQVSQAEQGIFSPEISFKRALLAYYEGKLELAWRYLDCIDAGSLSEAEHDGLLQFRELLRNEGIELAEGFSLTEVPAASPAAHRDKRRRLVEAKKLPLKPSLLRGLTNMPAEWIDAICLNLGIIGQGRRRDREKQIAGWLQDPLQLARLVRTLDDDQRSLLKHILEARGWVAAADIAPRFGGLEGESYDWLNDGTSTTLGTLWSLALLMVGQASIDGRNVRIAAIPAELIPLLNGVLNDQP